MPDEPDGHKVTGVEGDVEKRGEVAEEIDREVLSLIEEKTREAGRWNKEP